MAKKKLITKSEPDGTYLLKLVLYLIIGSQWLRLVDPGLTKQIPLPLGLLIGIIFASHEHFQIDRKIEYAVLLIACLVGFWAQTGISIYTL
jgi:hypothetical protein